MSGKLKMGILGAGVLGKYHTKLTKENPNAELIGIYDVIPAAAQALAAKNSIPHCFLHAATLSGSRPSS